MSQKGRDGFGPHARRPAGVLMQSRQLGTKHEEAGKTRPVDRLDAQPITDQRQHPGLSIPHSKREHPDEAVAGDSDAQRAINSVSD